MTPLLVFLILGTICGGEALYFEDNYDHHYTYSSVSDILGLHNVTTIIKFRIRSVNDTDGGVSLHQLMVDSFVQVSEKGYVVDNPKHWQFTHKFFFTVGNDGVVTFVHFHPEEKNEVLTMKKVLASTLSVKRKVDNDNHWRFTSTEEDHTGQLEHEYEASRHSDGITFVRKHQSSKDVHRLHNKTVNVDLRGTPVHVDSIDNITLRHTPSKVSSKTMDGFEEIEEQHSGEFPKISSISRSTVKMTSKRRHNEWTSHSVRGMQKDTLTVRQMPPEKVPLQKVEKDIQSHLACVHAIDNKYDRNRTECVHNLRELIYSLKKEDFLNFGTKALTQTCEDFDILCKDERNLFIDIIAREGSVEAQLLVLDLVMRSPNVTEDDLRRCLFHAIAITSPALEIVQHIEALCFGDDAKPGETPTLTKTRKRACLSLGAMAKSLHDKNITESDRIVEKIENWLDHHNQTRSMNIVKPRERRSITQHDMPARKHIETKMVLIQSLGNAGKSRSLQHIKSYMEPNAGVTAWRRAAIHSLRHFSCNESAHALLTSAVHDDDDIVRKTATNVLKKHPQRDNFTIEQENVVLSKNYSYPIVSRVRRSLLQTLEQGIQVLIKPPGIEWDKTIGNQNIGASFGLHIRNILDLKLSLLSGHFMVDVYDGAYAEAHVGMIDFQVDIVKAYICFKGRIAYDLNVLKDFGINSLSDLVHIYDKIVAKIVTPITDAIKHFREIIMLFKDRGLKQIVNSIVKVVKNLPTILGDVSQRLKKFVVEIFDIAGSTIVEEIKIIIQNVRNFVDGIKQDVLKFYNDVVDAITLGLPYISKKIVDAYNLIISSLSHLLDNPMQAITSMSRAISSIKMAVTMAVDIKNKVIDACMFLKGRAVEWLNTAKQIPSIIKRLGEALKKLVKSIAGRKRRDLESEMTTALSDGIGDMKNSLHNLETDLKAKWDQVLEPLKPLIDIVKPFVDEFKAIMDLIKGVKWGYKNAKKAIETSKSLVQKVFGPKFHRNFPTERRRAKGSCKEGVWPTTTQKQYQTTGVDIALGIGQSIVMPVNGILHVDSSKNRVVVQPTDPEFMVLEIVIENIVPEEKWDEKQVNAGTKIGRASKAPKCEPNFIHVSVRQAQDKTVPDADYDYTDPGPFLDRLVPIPKWIQECNDHEFRYIGQTFESGETDEEEDPESKEEKVERDPPDFDELDGMLGEEDPEYRPDDPSLYDPTSFGDSLKESLKEQAKKFADFFKTALFGKGGPKIPNILDIVNVNNKTVRWVFENLAPGKQLYLDFDNLVDKMAHSMVAVPVGNPATMSLSFVKKFIKLQGITSSVKGGDVSNVADSLMETAGKVCPWFKGRIAAGFGHVCTVHKCCLGITCSVPVPFGAKTQHLELSFDVNPSDSKIVFKVNKKSFEFTANALDEEINTDIKLFGMQVYLITNAEIKKGVVSMTAEVKLCTRLFATCLPPIDLFHDIKFQLGSSCKTKRSASSGSIENKAQILEMSIPTFVAQLGEYMLLDKNVTKVLEDVRDTVVKELMNDLADKIGEVVKEFKDKVDFCVSANIPVPPFDINFFSVRQHFMVGPVPLSLGFGAGGSVGLGVKVGLCVLSMTTQLTLTPWVGGKVWGDAAVDIFVARGGIRLIGYLMETKFPMTTELVFSKYPIDVGAKMDLVLTPLRLQLKAFAELNLFFKRVTVFEGLLWQYSVPTIRKNIFHKKKRDDDPSPPAVLPNTINERRKRSGTRGCIVQQVFGRPYYDPAFKIEMHAQDEVSEVKLFYAIGTHPGGTNIVDWTDMGGNSLMVPTKLPGGIPLYWSVKAQNSQGLSSISQCHLNTFDSTLPDGRVEHPYKFSSHPNKIIASVVAFEDSPLVETHYKAIGFSPGQYGSQFVDWQNLRLDHSATRSGVTGALKQFTISREGKLVAWILKSQSTPNAETCAQACISYGSNCVSFDYEHHSETCDLHDVVQGANAYLRISGTYSNYERLGSGYHTPIEYSGLPLTHGSTYFVNAKVTNILGYDAYLVGEGTMVDFTPPEPGVIRNARQDILRADKCNAAVTQQCIDVTWKNNHRVIIDGKGSGTVFNGHQPVFDELYTLTNHYVSANWKGFHDDESGLWGFTWAVGRDVCGTDVVKYNDPYAHLTSKKFWTDSGFHKGIHLEDGPYFVTVQALNGAELGGSLVTTVCHSTPFIVDTTPPVFNSVTDIIYDEDFDLIAIYYNATDDLSKISDAEFGLGKTKYDVQLKPYSLHVSMERDDPFVAVEELGLQEGIPAWIRIRVTNNVELFTAGHGDEPIMIDKSPPIAGNVLDGDHLRIDKAFQSDDKNICAQWIDFYDPQSGLDRFLWGVGTKPGDDDVVKFRNLTRYEKSACTNAMLSHNQIYYSTVFAFNNALNSKSANSSSDGVLVDVTNPIAGHVYNGKANEAELSFSSETVSKYVNWNGYYDPESGIDHYKVDVVINNEKRGTFEAGKATEFRDHTISMEHKDQVRFTVHGVNGAGLENASDSDDFTVDLTPPILKGIADNDKALAFQCNNTRMDVMFEFQDTESGIKEYRVVIYETRYGVKQKFWPNDNQYNKSVPSSPSDTKMHPSIKGLSLKDGATYSLHVTALNRALLASSHETNGVTVDTTPPVEPKVHIGLLKDEEELDEQGNVLHNDQFGIRVSWSGRDSESGIKSYQVAIGTTQSNMTNILNFTDYGVDITAYIQNIFFQTSEKLGITYVVYVRAENGAGLYSKPGKSKPIFVQKANVPGIVFDGRNLFQDEMYTTDFTSIAASFYGFESDSCNILSYDWAIGTSEYGTDIQTYTNYGLVMLNETHGQCQTHIELFEDTKYFITVRAVTGCQDEYILSSSDGITLDRIPPEVIYKIDDSNDSAIVNVQSVIYQDTTDTLSVSSNVTDTNSINSVEWALGSLPLLDDRHPYTQDFSEITSVVTLTPGEASFITTNSSDKAGNINVLSSLAIIADATAPLIRNFDCTKYISARKTLLSCMWETVEEYESQIDKITISLGSNSTSSDLLDEYVVPEMFRSFKRDLNDHIKLLQNMTSLFVNANVRNVVGQTKSYGMKIIVDRTLPKVDLLAVVTHIGTGNVSDHQKCQIPRAFAELRPYGIIDEESGIDHNRYEVSIGFAPYSTDVIDYTPVHLEENGIIFVDGFTLHEGAVFYATLRVYNHAGLKTEVTSDSVVISQSPVLSVIDGTQDDDIDYQSMPNLLQGKWKYSDLCPIKEALWSVTDLTGKVLFDFQPIPSASQIFYNDEVALENGMKYIVTVKIVDFLGRTKIARSDGVSVRIQPPLPGMVRDGLQEDLNYQFSTTELSANWDDFGDGSKDPTQAIHHYEVSIGNDRRYEKTRSNIHFFVNVGLNTSFTFKALNLTSKLVKYYVTVRSYSMAGGYTEGYSNGIRVGFNDDISPGTMSVKRYQSSTNSVEVSWTGFRSDIDIIDYMIGISSHDNVIINDTIRCSIFYQNSTKYDIYGLSSVNINEYKMITGLKLHHGDRFFITIIAKDEAGMCIGITSEEVLVDTSPPQEGSLYINNIRSDTVIFAESDTKLKVKWTDFNDKESGVLTTKVSLIECKTCYNVHFSNSNCIPIAENKVENDEETAFYELELSSEKVYHIYITLTNGANLLTNALSKPILVDTSSPLPGIVKIAKKWHSLDTFQNSTSELHGLLAIASTSDDYKCPTRKHYFPAARGTVLQVLSKDFSSDFVVVNSTGAFLGIGYNADLSKLTKSSIVSEPLPLERGNYTFTSKVAKGKNIITTYALITDSIAIPFIIEEKPVEVEFDESIFENMTGLAIPESNVTTTNITTLPSITTKMPGSFVPTNDNASSTDTNFATDEYGFGVHFLGYKIGQNKHWHHLFWARNKITSIQRWFSLPFDYSANHHKLTILVDKKSEYLETTLDLTLIIDGEELINIAGFKFVGDIKIAALTWNENGYEPPITDIYKPFYSDAVIRRIDIPDENDKLCRYGRGFYDGESGIKEIWVGVSDSKFELGNVLPLSLHHQYCYACHGLCENLCKMPCPHQKLSDGFELISVDIKNLDMKSTSIDDSCNNVTSDIQCNSTSYYMNVKIVNYAGLESIAYSNAIQIDLTPPECDYIKCLDPDYSEDEPTQHLGSSSTIGAYWNCSEDISQIESYIIRVLDSSNNETVMNSTSVGLKTKTVFRLENGTFKNGKNYVVELTSVNTAGLSVTKNCQVLVSLFPPDTSGAATLPLYTTASYSTADEDVPYWTTSQTEIGIEWEGGNSKIEYYEWQIGTSRNGKDVFPPVKVGQKKTGSSAIVHGKLEFDRKAINKSVAEFRNMTAMTPDEIHNITDTSEKEKAFFNMEPGRCVHQSLYAIGYSHLKSKIQGKTVCIKRVGDVYLNGTQRKVVASKPKSSNKWSASVVPLPQIAIDADLISGGLSLGTLSKDDLSNDYGSAATTDYKPFIKDPETSLDKTTRLLRNRIKKLCNMTFFVSPAPLAEYEQIRINITMPNGCEKDPDYQPALIFWDTDKEQWVHVDEGCRNHLTAVVASNAYTSEICKESNGTKSLTRRATTSMYSSPRTFALSQISRKFPNNPPSILTDSLQLFEDTPSELLVKTVDLENDTLEYEITNHPSNVVCEISKSNGLLNCTSNEDFNGVDTIKIKVTETGLPEFEEALFDEKSIILNITGVPDKTDRYFIDSNGTIYSDIRPSMTKTFILEANQSSSFDAGQILLADVDKDEIFKVKERFVSLGNSTFTLIQTDSSSIQMENITSKVYNSLQSYDVRFEFSPELSGNMSFQFIAKLADGSLTPSVTIELFILNNPCVYGHCSPLGSVGCDDILRSISFADFQCSCYPGYEGQWCQTETNECQWEPCALMFDCEDLINEYKCNINIPKLMAILMCSILAIGGASFLIWKLVKRFKPYTVNKISPSTVDLKCSEVNETFEMDEDRPRTSASIFLESARPGTPAASTLLDDTVSAPANTSFTTAPGVILPPHHAFNNKGLKSSKPTFQPSSIQLSCSKEWIETEPKITSMKLNVQPKNQSLLKKHETPIEDDDPTERSSPSQSSTELEREVSGLSAIDI